MRRWPLKVFIFARSDGTMVDYSKVPGATLVNGDVWRVPVFAWEVTKSRRDLVDGFVSLVDTLRIYSPPHYFYPGQRIGDTEAVHWTVDGEAEDNNNNPYWSPGLVVWYARDVRPA